MAPSIETFPQRNALYNNANWIDVVRGLGIIGLFQSAGLPGAESVVLHQATDNTGAGDKVVPNSQLAIPAASAGVFISEIDKMLLDDANGFKFVRWVPSDPGISCMTIMPWRNGLPYNYADGTRADDVQNFIVSMGDAVVGARYDGYVADPGPRTLFAVAGAALPGAVIPNVPPVAAVVLSPIAAGALTVTADGSTSTDADGTIATYDWVWGDGNSSMNAGPTPPAHLYTTAGTYNIALTVTDDQGAANTQTQSVTVPPPTQADPIARLTLRAAGMVVTANANGSRAVSVGATLTGYKIEWGEPGSVADASPDATYIYANPGTYTVKLTVTDSDGKTATTTVSTGALKPVPLPGTVVPYQPRTMYSAGQTLIYGNTLWRTPADFTSSNLNAMQADGTTNGFQADLAAGKVARMGADGNEIRSVRRFANLPTPASTVPPRIGEIYMVREDDNNKPLNRLYAWSGNPTVPAVWEDVLPRMIGPEENPTHRIGQWETEADIVGWMNGSTNTAAGATRPVVGTGIYLDAGDTWPRNHLELGTTRALDARLPRLLRTRGVMLDTFTFLIYVGTANQTHQAYGVKRNSDGGRILWASAGFMAFDQSGAGQRIGWEVSPQITGTMAWQALTHHASTKIARLLADNTTPHRDGDLQLTQETDHLELKWWDQPGNTWQTVFSEDTIKQWIAQGSMFRGTVEEVKAVQDPGDIALSALPVPSVTDLSRNGEYWVWNGQDDYEVTATTPIIGADLQGQRLSPGDWLRLVDRTAHPPPPAPSADADYHWLRIPGNILSKDRADKSYGLHNWMAGAWEKDSLVMFNGKVYRAVAGVVAGDPAPAVGAPPVEGQGAPGSLTSPADLTAALAQATTTANAGNFWVNTSTTPIPWAAGGTAINPGDAILNTGNPAWGTAGFVLVAAPNLEGGVPSFTPTGGNKWIDLKIGGVGAAPWAPNKAYKVGDEFFIHQDNADTAFPGVDYLFRATAAIPAAATFDANQANPPFAVVSAPVFVSSTPPTNPPAGAQWIHQPTKRMYFLDPAAPGGWVSVQS